LEDVRLPADAVLGGVTGLRGPLSCLNEARFGIVFGALGAARDCLETAIEYAGDPGGVRPDRWPLSS
jgi:glutaryl-CoA dehydrogenase